MSINTTLYYFDILPKNKNWILGAIENESCRTNVQTPKYKNKYIELISLYYTRTDYFKESNSASECLKWSFKFKQAIGDKSCLF